MAGLYDEFREIAEALQELPTDFSALFRQAELHLLKERPEGFNIHEIGERAWSRLPIEQWPQAMRTLFYCFWMVEREERREDELRKAAMAGGTSWLDESSLGRINDCLAAGPDRNGFATEVNFEALSSVAAEVGLLRKRLELLRDALVDNEHPF